MLRIRTGGPLLLLLLLVLLQAAAAAAFNDTLAAKQSPPFRGIVSSWVGGLLALVFMVISATLATGGIVVCLRYSADLEPSCM